MDLVAHCDDSNRGSYVHNLTLTDIASGWTECAPLVVRESSLLLEALERVRQGLPFTLRALDVDNVPKNKSKPFRMQQSSCVQSHRHCTTTSSALRASPLRSSAK